MIKIFVVDDHTLFRRGLVGLLSEMDELEVIGDAESGEHALLRLPEAKPDVLLLDVNMPGMSGIETLKAVRKCGLDMPVLMLTISQQEEDLLGAIQAGASGYLLKNAEPDHLHQTILHVVAGRSVLSPEMTAQVFRLVRSGKLSTSELLSEREMEVLRRLARGLTTSLIASELFISENTVKTHIRHILEKLDVSNRAEAVAKALQLGIL